ncbi:MAG: hypothetical protein PVF89_00635 [Lysobacterales bacterium]
MALALSKPALRNGALLDIAAAAHVLDRAAVDKSADGEVLARQFLDDRGWLARLVERYGWREPHGTVLDPAAWLVQKELQQHELPVMAREYPGRMPQSALLYQVFQRADERLAAANLSALLLDLEAGAVGTWDRFLQLTGADKAPQPAWKPVATEWFADRNWPAVAAFIKFWPAYAKNRGGAAAGGAVDTARLLSQLSAGVVETGPSDPLLLTRLRFASLERYASLAAAQKQVYRDRLYIASLIDGLQDGRYIDFAAGMLSLVSEQLEYAREKTDVSVTTHWLVRELPPVLARFSADFAAVDPNLNTVLTMAHAVLQNIETPGSSAMTIRSPRLELADAVARLDLMIPDMGFYFNTPVRARIIEEINICTSIAASRDADGYPTMTRRQFDGCMENFLRLASTETRSPELSGDTRGPFSADALQRELAMTPPQRINYGIGFLHDRFPTDCPLPAQALPNPLEWAVLATSMAWFAEYKPEFFSTPDNESRLASMRSAGEQAIQAMALQARCFADSGGGGNDPVSRNLAVYETALRELNAGIENAEADFRRNNLRPGADVQLDRGTDQHTGYRPDGLLIGPCDRQKICEMSASLSTTRALIGLFPETYLLADQTRMGKVQICYRDMGWVHRRSELVRPEDEDVANYYGHLGFDLIGRYVESGQSRNIFGFRFESPREHLYLFAQASPEVLADKCPMEWVGTRVVTPLRETRGGVVPNRLTYLAAARALPSRLLQNNWDRGEEWRDWFVTGIGVKPLPMPAPPDISNQLNQHLQVLYQAEQAEIYRRVLSPDAQDASGENVSLFGDISSVSTAKEMLRMQIMLFYPGSLTADDAIRSAIAGDAGLLDIRMMRRFKADNISPVTVEQSAQFRLQQLEKAWLDQPGALRRNGSIPASLAYALTRLNSLYRQFFTLPAEVPEAVGKNIDAAAKPGEPKGG